MATRTHGGGGWVVLMVSGMIALFVVIGIYGLARKANRPEMRLSMAVPTMPTSPDVPLPAIPDAPRLPDAPLPIPK